MPNLLIFVGAIILFVVYGLYSIKQGRERMGDAAIASNANMMKFRAIRKFVIGGWCIFCAVVGVIIFFTTGFK